MVTQSLQSPHLGDRGGKVRSSRLLGYIVIIHSELRISPVGYMKQSQKGKNKTDSRSGTGVSHTSGSTLFTGGLSCVSHISAWILYALYVTRA